MASCSKCSLWDPSQNGLFCESPQRQIETISLPCRLYTFPFLSTISKSPSTFSEPLLFTVIFVVGMVAVYFFKVNYLLQDIDVWVVMEAALNIVY